MKISEQIHCIDYPCTDVRYECLVIPDIDLNPDDVSIVMISESAPADPGDYFLNNLFKFTPITFIIDLILGIFVNIGDPKKRLRIMQNVSKTCVVRTK